MLAGIDQLDRVSTLLNAAKLAVLCHHCSVNSSGKHLIELLGPSRIEIILEPEHGLSGVEDCWLKDRNEKIPIASLHNPQVLAQGLASSKLSNCDALVIDLQDIGSRYYTYCNSAVIALRAAKQSEIPVVVFDRPNPISGCMQGCLPQNFDKQPRILQRHGLTLGEQLSCANLGITLQDEIGANLEVVPCTRLNASLYFDELFDHWTPPSPAILNLDCAICYSGTCLFEGTNLSEGRGTPKPFQLIGAPFIDESALAKEVLLRASQTGLSGASVNPTRFTPQFSKFAHVECRGIDLQITNRDKFEPILWALTILACIQELYAAEFNWIRVQSSGEFRIDQLWGDSRARQLTTGQTDLTKLRTSWVADVKEFGELVSPCLLYQQETQCT